MNQAANMTREIKKPEIEIITPETMPKIKLDIPEEKIRQIIREEIASLFASDRYIFSKLIQILDGRNIQLGITTGTRIGTGATQKLSFFNATPVIRQTDGADLTNNVTAGGTTDVIANYTDLSIYANDAAAIRNDIYQLARKLKIIGDALRDYGLLS